MARRFWGLRLFCRRFFRLRFAAYGKRQLVHQLRVLALDQHPGIIGNRVHQRFQPDLVRLGEISQDMSVHQFLVSGVADADAQPAIILAAMGVERFDAVVPAVASGCLEPRSSRWQIEFIVDRDDICRRQLVEAHGLANGLAREVHEGLRLHQQNLLAVDLAFRDHCLELLRPRRKARPSLNGVNSHETDIVAVACVLRSGIAKASNDQH
ncbi:hypothetical protein D3C80_441800 [compost metagenome]